MARIACVVREGRLGEVHVRTPSPRTSIPRSSYGTGRHWTIDPKIDNESGSTYHVLPKVLLPFDSARRKNCAALNCEAVLAILPLSRISRCCAFIDIAAQTMRLKRTWGTVSMSHASHPHDAARDRSESEGHAGLAVCVECRMNI
jgi:hypothetical protein